MRLRPLVLDLDGTLLHTQPAPGAVTVPGRTRPSFLAGATLDALVRLGRRYDLVLATGRSLAGTRIVAEALESRGARVAGLVVEDGGRCGPPGAVRPLEPHRRWRDLRAALEGERERGWPRFEWQEDFESCLVARAAEREEAAALAPILLDRARRHDAALRGFRDGRKVYIAGEDAHKWSALQALLGEGAREAAGIGDGENDLVWLGRVALPCTLAGASPAATEAVGRASGIVSRAPGHAGLAEILERLEALA